MGILDRLLRNAVNDAVEEGVRKAVQPQINKAAEKAANDAASAAAEASSAQKYGHQEDNAAQTENTVPSESDAEILARWQSVLPEYPVWRCGGSNFEMHVGEDDYIYFAADFPTHASAEAAVQAYRALLYAAGFEQNADWKTDEHLYKRVNGRFCHVDTEHCFEAGAECAGIYFTHSAPAGGLLSEKKPEKKKSGFFGGLFG